MNKLARLSTIGASLATAGILSIGTGVASADSMSSNTWFGGSGGGNHNVIPTSNLIDTIITNNNRINITNVNRQLAISGDAFVSSNTNGNNNNANHCQHRNQHHFRMMAMHRHHHFSNSNNNFGGQGGSATTGDATNTNNTVERVNVTNTAPVNTAPVVTASRSSHQNNFHQPVRQVVETRVTNNNDITINNTNEQFAMSGDATVSGNTRGGSATTGDAMNDNSTDISVIVANNLGNN